MDKYGVSLGDLLEPTHGDEIVYLASDVAELESRAVDQALRIRELEKALRDIADRKSFHTIEEIRAIANSVLMDSGR